MSDPNASSAFEALKAYAKQVLALARNSDAVVISKLREFLPRLAPLNDADFASEVKLADVQHAVARKRGAESWGELKRRIHAADPLQLQAERFLRAIREDEGKEASQFLADTPEIARYSIRAAAAACDVEALQEFLAADATLATKIVTADTRTPIVYACATPLVKLNEALKPGSARCVELLLQHGADANAWIPFGDEEARLSVLYFVSATNNVDAVRALLNAGANPNDGESIYHSAERNYRDVMQLLLDAGCDIAGRSADYNNTPLYFLAGYKPFNELCASSEEGMKWLMEHGADPNIPSYVAEKYKSWPSSGETPLHRVAEYGKGVDIMRAIVEHHANVNATRADGRTPYALAVRTGNTVGTTYLASVGANTDALNAIDRLLGACALADSVAAHRIVAENPNIIAELTANDRQALSLAAEEGNADAVRLMVSLGWSLSDEGAWAGTPLHQAAWHGQVDMTRLLLELGAPIDFRDTQFGSSPIAWAAHGSTNARPGHDDEYCAVVNLLLDAGASREASYNKWNEAPESFSSKAVAKLLKQRGFAA